MGKRHRRAKNQKKVQPLPERTKTTLETPKCEGIKYVFEPFEDDVPSFKIDPMLPVRTRSGWPARIQYIDPRQEDGAIKATIYSGSQITSTFSVAGRFLSDKPHEYDLFNITLAEWEQALGRAEAKAL